jgi:hypothetical protein
VVVVVYVTGPEMLVIELVVELLNDTNDVDELAELAEDEDVL